MVEIKLHVPIDKCDQWLAAWGGEEAVFSLETVQRIFSQHESETDFKFNIHCDGGSVFEGLAIYDALRTSGKNIFMNIEGGCHSMAVTLLLAAPFENRTANANARALIHEVQVPINEWSLSTTELQELTEQAKREQNAILDIYAERTGTDRAILEQLMSEQKFRTASELLQYGFISKINSYNTNKVKRKTMNSKIAEMLNGILNYVNGQPTPTNFDFSDADGNVILSTEREDETIEVGDAVVLPEGATEGEVTLADGRTIVVADGKVVEVRTPETEEAEPAPAPENEAETEEPAPETDEKDEKIAELEAKVTELEAELAEKDAKIAELEKDTAEVEEEIKNLKNAIKSNFVPTARVQNQAKVENKLSHEEITNQARSRKKQF